jgi:hypothetical protein
MRAADGHWWPESFYLASLQSREALYEVRPVSASSKHYTSDYSPSQVLKECVDREELTNDEAVTIIKRLLFDNANKLYKLNLQPVWSSE